MMQKNYGKNSCETIKALSKKLVDSNKGIIIGQCLSTVSWVQNTVPPQKKGIVELPMTDVAGAVLQLGLPWQEQDQYLF